jgi:hypothetical protein
MRLSQLVFLFLFVPASSFAQKSIVKSLLAEVPVAAPEKTAVMFLGCSHFGQEGMYKGNPAADLFGTANQKEIAAINNQLARYQPDLILVERAPEDQAQLDSLYSRYYNGQLRFTDLPYGRAEEYQFGFALAKKLGHKHVFGTDYYESVSNRMLNSGTNREGFQKGLDSFSAVGRKADGAFKEGALNLSGFLRFLNNKQVLDWTYQVLFVAPLEIKNGAFTAPPVKYVDTAFVNKTYIGAEFVSVFLERELKIYTNIVTIQKAQQAKRVLVIMGHRHAAALPTLFVQNPAYRVVPVTDYLK